MKEIKELRGKFPHELTKEEIQGKIYIHSDDLKEGFIKEILEWYRDNSYNKEILLEDKKEREDIIERIKHKGNKFEKEIINKINKNIITDWHQLAVLNKK